MTASLVRRATAEFVGTALLVAAIIGSGIAAQRLSPGDVGLELLENAFATAATLVAIIAALGPISGAHLNPAVTLADRLLGGISWRDLAAYWPAQILGASFGAVVANLMFSLAPITISTKVRSGTGLLFAEVVATFGLILIIHGVVRSGRLNQVAFIVGAYIAGAYWFTASTSFANPAVAIAREFSNTFAGIAPASVPGFLVAQLIGSLLAVPVVRFLFREPSSEGNPPA